MKIVSLVGARPQFIKEAMLNAKVRETEAWTHVLAHSGQHYDFGMSGIFFQELGIPEPDYNLGVGSGTHAEVTAATMTGMEKLLLAEKPDALLVYGDTNTTLGGALAAAKIHVPIIHVEAGIRMLPKDMPEEINRQLTDRISSVLCCCSALAVENLAAEGITHGVHDCGDIMLDVYMRMQSRMNPGQIADSLGLHGAPYVVATIHRDYNVDDVDRLGQILSALQALGAGSGMKVVLPLHPRARKKIAENNLGNITSGIKVVEPLGYLELMSLVQTAEFVITDSGGLQKESYYAGKRAVVIMPDTGWRELTLSGWNILANADSGEILKAAENMLQHVEEPCECYGGGDAASHIIAAIQREFGIMNA